MHVTRSVLFKTCCLEKGDGPGRVAGAADACQPEGRRRALLQRECGELAFGGLHHQDAIGHHRFAGDRTAHAGARGERAIGQAQPVHHAFQVADRRVVALDAGRTDIAIGETRLLPKSLLGVQHVVKRHAY